MINPKSRRLLLILAAVAALVALPVYSAIGGSSDPNPPGEFSVSNQTAIGDSFTYQGRLTESNQPANGTYDFQFTIFGAASGSAQVCTAAASDIETRDDVTVANGVFTVELDFCAEAFDGDARWLEIGVRAGSSTGTYTILSPRQPVSPAPYALYAKRTGGLQVPFAATGASTGTGSVFSVTQTGTTTPGIAVLADGATGTGAKVSGDVAAIEIDGPIKVSGTKSAFQVVVDGATNLCSATGGVVDDAVIIPATVANAATDIIIYSIVDAPEGLTEDLVLSFSPGADCPDATWVIYSRDDQLLPDDLTFNVLVIKQ